MRTLQTCFMFALAIALTPVRAGSDTLVNDRTGDPVGRGQDSPTVAEVYNSSYGNMLVVLWHEAVASTLPRFNLAVSRLSPIAFADLGAPPAPAGYQWLREPIVRSYPPGLDEDGSFFIAGSVRSNAANPLLLGVGFVRGHVLDPGHVVFDSPTLLVDFGASPSGFIYFGILTMAMEPASGAIHVLYDPRIYGSPDPGYQTRSSLDGGITWSAPVTVGSDPDLAGGGPMILCGLQPGDVNYLWQESDASGLHTLTRCRHSSDRGVTLDPITIAFTVSAYAPWGPGRLGTITSSVAGTVDRSGGVFNGELVLGGTIPMDLYSDVYPDPALVGSIVESEPNGTPGEATPFPIVGTTIRGNLVAGAVRDTDYFAVPLSRGQQVAVWADSSSPSLAFGYCDWIGPDGRTVLTGSQIIPYLRLGFVAPENGVYYLRVDQAASYSGAYRLRTTLAAAPYPGASDQRDVALSLKDAGGDWTGVQIIAPNSPPGYDAAGIALASNVDGALYATYTDFSVAPGRALASKVIRRSTNGGATWSPPAPISTADTDWSQVYDSSDGGAVQGGEYDDLACDGASLFAVWADGRNGDSDIYFKWIWRSITVPDRTTFSVTAHPGETVSLTRTVQNLDDVMPFGVRVELVNTQRNWYLPPSTGTLAAGQTAPLPFTFTVPDTATPGTSRLNVAYQSDASPHVAYAMLGLNLQVVANTDVAGGASFALELAPVTPNPACGELELAFSLTRPGEARLSIYDLGGRLVRRLAGGAHSAGRHSLVWDRTNERGGTVDAGVYFARLEAEGRTLTRRFVCIR